jgi:hypothetical protein
MMDGAPGFARPIERLEAKVDSESRRNMRHRDQADAASGFSRLRRTVLELNPISFSCPFLGESIPRF